MLIIYSFCCSLRIAFSFQSKSVCPFLPVLPVGLLRPFPCCLLLASLRMSMMSVANSRALKRASFWRPWEKSTSGVRTWIIIKTHIHTHWHDRLKFVLFELCGMQMQSSPQSVVHCLCDCCGQGPCAVEKHSHSVINTPSHMCSHIHKHEERSINCAITRACWHPYKKIKRLLSTEVVK